MGKILKAWTERLAASAVFTGPRGSLDERIVQVKEHADDSWTIEVLTGSSGKLRSKQAAFNRQDTRMYYLLEIGKLVEAGFVPLYVGKFPLQL